MRGFLESRMLGTLTDSCVTKESNQNDWTTPSNSILPGSITLDL